MRKRILKHMGGQEIGMDKENIVTEENDPKVKKNGVSQNNTFWQHII